jgi:DNA-binding XRE family transcriptional regulator
MPTRIVCTYCEAEVGLVDEHGRCERCNMDADKRAVLLDQLDCAVEALLVRGLTPDQLREALEMALDNRAGGLSGDLVVRDRRLQAGFEVWDIPSSTWKDDRPTTSRLRKLRRRSGYTLEQLAAELGEDVSTVGLWEEGAQIPDEKLEYLSAKFGLSVPYMLGEVG